MKIVSLVAENIKKLKAVEITPSDAVVAIAGKNGAGKTSVLDSIWWALSGTTHIQAQPIRKGQTKARIKLNLGELIVERKFTASGSTLSVENAEGARFPSPQKMLDALIGALSFDPLAFARMNPKEQFEELRRISQVEIDLDAIDRLNASDYAKRTELNRDAKTRQAQADGILVSDNIPAEPIDEREMLDAIQKAGEHNLEIERLNTINVQVMSEATSFDLSEARQTERARQLREDAESCLRLAEEARVLAVAARKKVKEVPAPIDVTEIRATLDAARITNGEIEKLVRKTSLLKEVDTITMQALKLTQSMEARNMDKCAALAAANMPVDGLGLGEGCVTYKGVPLDQSSSAEQLRVSLSIAMAANPKLRVIRITDGSLLDDDSMAAIAEAAKKQDYQVWIERVDSSGKVGIVIDDGAVVAVDGEKVSA